MKPYIITLIIFLCTPFIGVHAVEQVWTDIGTKNKLFEYSHRVYADADGKIPHAYYTLTLEHAMEIEFDNYNGKKSTILQVTCADKGDPIFTFSGNKGYYPIRKVLPAGNYVILNCGWYGSGDYCLHLKGVLSSESPIPGNFPLHPIEIGNISESYSYTDIRDCSLYGLAEYTVMEVAYIYHRFTLQSPMNVRISYNGSDYSCTLKDISGNTLASEVRTNSGGNTTLQVNDLSAGEYYILSEPLYINNTMRIQIDFTAPTDGSEPYPELGVEDNNEIYPDRDGFRSYKFNYDPLNRLVRVTYGQSSNLGAVKRFGVPKISYDKHGNITRLKRWGKTSATGEGLMDDLELEYNGNQLRKVTDSGTAPTHAGAFNFVNRPNDGRADEYLYDENGNLIQDFNKKIADIQYNQLNLPQRVIFEDGKQIDYLYDTGGTKLQATYRNSANAQPYKTIDYYGNVIYENGVLSKVLTEEGYITFNGSTPIYHYYIKDHLGNVRVVLDQDGTVEQRNEYYPFGGLFADGGNTSDQRYKYGGKEFDREHGIDLYDFEARQMDPAIGRFTTMDPMAEKYYSISPYAYCVNNPMKFVDPDGKQIIIPPTAPTLPFMPPPPFVPAGVRPNTNPPSVGVMMNDLKSAVNNFIDGQKAIYSLFGLGIYLSFKGTDDSNEQGVVEEGQAEVEEAVDEAKDSSKNEKHGDRGRAKSKADSQIKKLKEQREGATVKEKKKIDQKIRNIEQDAQRKAKGEEHSRGNKR